MNNNEINNNENNNNITEIKKTKKIKVLKSNFDDGLKICKVCNISKPLDDYPLNKIINNRIYRKNICLDCKKLESKNYYHSNKEKILKSIKTKSDSLVKNYVYTIKFNDINDLDNEINKLKHNFLNNLVEFKKNERKPRKVKTEIIENISNN